LKEPFASLSEEARGRLQQKGMPGWAEPMLATLTDDHFSSQDCI